MEIETTKRPSSVDGDELPQPTAVGTNVSLVVTANAELQRAIAELCIEAGYRVARAGTLTQALELREAFSPTLSIVSALLPDQERTGGLRKLVSHASSERYNVVLLSGPYPSEEISEHIGPIAAHARVIDTRRPSTEWLAELREGLSSVRAEATRVEASLIRRQDSVPSLQGNLDACSFTDLYLYSMSSKHTGYLGLSDGEQKRVIFWQNGTPIYARSTDPEESFGTYLVKKGLLDQTKEAASREFMRRNGRMQSEALVELKLVDPAVVFEELRIHVRSMIIDCFGWIYGRYLISDDRRSLSRIVPMPLDATKILFEGIETFNDADEIERAVEIGPNDTVEFLERPLLDDWKANLTTKEMLAIKAARKGLSLQEICNESRMDYDATLRFLFSLFKIGALGFRTGAESEDAMRRRLLIGPEPTHVERDELSRIEEFVAMHIDARKMTYFELYNTPAAMQIDLNVVRRRYVELSKRFHPDRFRKYAHWNLERQVDELGQKINLGYETLRDDERRQAYLDELTGESEASRRRKANEQRNREAAKAAREAGTANLFAGEAALATESFRLALELVPDDSFLSTWYLFARFWENPSQRRRETYEQLQKLAEGGSESRSDSLYQLGVIDLHAGALKLAQRRFEGALKDDPHHKLAREAATVTGKALSEPSPEHSLALVEGYLARFRRGKRTPSVGTNTPLAAESTPQVTIDEDSISIDFEPNPISGVAYPRSPGPRPPGAIRGAESALTSLAGQEPGESKQMPGAPKLRAGATMTLDPSAQAKPASVRRSSTTTKPAKGRSQRQAGSSKAPKSDAPQDELYDLEDIFDEIDI
ncbi:MAG: hypothetical protein KC609_00150 [Myxococcales bacterium]|nr:hypothetical protein [Myxococcales bacterium]